ncbi:hypothetical protein D3C73_1328960 [compost metagenome]
MYVDAAHTAHGLQGSAEIGDIGRRVAVRRFAPALGAADHATGNHRQIGLRIQPVAAGIKERQFKTVGAHHAADGSWRDGQLHDAARQRALFQHLAICSEFVST